VPIDGLHGFWRGSMLLALGETLKAAGRKDEAAAAYRQLLADETVLPNHRKEAEDAIHAFADDDR
jgi:hypothetical protein